MASETAVKAAEKIDSDFGLIDHEEDGGEIRHVADIIDAAFAPVLAAKDAEIERLNKWLVQVERNPNAPLLLSERDALAAQVAELKVLLTFWRPILKTHIEYEIPDDEECWKMLTAIDAALQEPSRDE